MMINLDAAQRHLRLVAGEPDPVVAWQVFDDSKTDPALARGFHGRLDQVLPLLRKAQARGCGVYIAVNATDGTGRRKENMRFARAVFLDLDGAPLPESWPMDPDLIVHSSSHDRIDKYQCWWLIDPTDDWATWRAMQMALAERYGGDRKCSLVTQVGRCAGFYHLKHRDRPWNVRIVADSTLDETVRMPLDILAAAFGFDLTAVKLQYPARNEIDRPPPILGWDNELDVEAARQLLANGENWVPTSDGAYSVFRMACRLHDLGISQALATEMIEEHVPGLPASAEHDSHYVEKKVANAYRYARNAAGSWSHEADRRAMIAAIEKATSPEFQDSDFDIEAGGFDESDFKGEGHD
jgi:hypothetical protein